MISTRCAFLKSLVYSLALGGMALLSGCQKETPTTSASKADTAHEQTQENGKAKPRVSSLGTQTRTTQISRAAVHATTLTALVTPLAETALTGRVTLEDGSPAAGTTVTARTITMLGRMPDFDNLPEVASAVTDEKGRYVIASATNAFFLEAVKIGFGLEAADLDARPSPGGFKATKFAHDFTLKPARPVEGMVVDITGAPVPGAIVRARPTQPRRRGASYSTNVVTTASAEGRFRIDGFSAEALGVVAMAEDLGFVSQEVKAPQTAVRLVLPSKGAHLRGTLTRKETGGPVENAKVQFISSSRKNASSQFLMPGVSVLTDALGNYTVRNLPAGEYRVNAKADGLGPFGVKDMEGLKLVVKGTETDLKQDLVLYAGHTVSGTVTDRKSGKPLPDVAISSMLPGPAGKAAGQSNEQGRYELQHLFPIDDGDSQPRTFVIVNAEGYSVVDESNGTGTGMQMLLEDDVLSATKDILLLPNVTITGNVVTEEGMPPSDCTIQDKQRGGWLAETAKPQRVDSTGKFEIQVRPAASAILESKAPGYPTVRTTVEVGEESVTGTKILLKRGAQIKGTVVFTDDTPVPGAKVDVRTVSTQSNEEAGSATSNEAGAFTITDVAPGQLTISATAKGFIGSKQEKLRLSSGETTSGIRLVLEKAHYVAGTVRDEAGKPIEGAHVQYRGPVKNGTTRTRGGVPGLADPGMSGMDGVSTQTDALGHYRLEGMPAGSARLIASARKHDQEEKPEVAVDADNVDFVLRSKRPARFIGIVLESNTETPITDFTVEGSKNEPVPDQPNQFVLTELFEGDSASLSITAPGHVKLQVQANIPKGKSEESQTFHLAKASQIQGRVVGKENKAPLAGVVVTLEGKNQNYYSRNSQSDSQPKTRTDAEGRFTLDGAEPGNITVSFTPSAPYAKLYVDVPVEAGTPADMGDVTLDTGGSIVGRVVKMPGETGVANTMLTLRGNRAGIQKSTTSAGDGSFEFKDLPNDSYTVSAGHQGSVVVMLDAFGRKEVTIRIGSVILKGTVTRAGQPVAGASVNLRSGTYGASSSKGAQTDEGGQFSVTNLSPGKWAVLIYASDGGGGSFSEDIDLPETGTVEKTFVMPSGVIAGIVVDKEGKPVGQAIVRAKGGAGENAAWNEVLPGNFGSSQATSASDGTFELRNVKPGKFLLSASKKGVGQSKPVEAEAPLEGTSEKITLTVEPVETGELVSVALNMTTGGPIKEAWCMLWTATEKLNTSAERGDDGIMTIKDLPAGTYKVQVSSFGFAVAEHEVTIEAGKTTRLEDVLYEAGAVRLSVVDKNGAPVANADCTLTPDDPKSIERTRHGKTDTSGLWVIRGLYPGTYSATAMASGKTPGKAGTSVVAHQPVDLVVRLD